MPKIKRRTETIISFFILLLLAALSAAILIAQSRYDLGRYGFGTVKHAVSTQTFRPLDTSALAPAGYSAQGKEFTFDAESLYEKINGRAPLYLTAGYKKLTTRRFVSQANPQLWFELFLYDMGSLKNAFSVYSRQRRENARYPKPDWYAYITDNTYNMAHNNYYIEIIGSKADTRLSTALQHCADTIRKLHPVVPALTEPALLKNSAMILHSESFYIDNAFGIKELSQLYSAQYTINNIRTTVYISGPFDAGTVTSMRKKFTAYLLKEEAVSLKTDVALPGFTILEFDGGYYAHFSALPYFAGVHDAKSKKQAEALSILLHETLKKNGGLQ